VGPEGITERDLFVVVDMLHIVANAISEGRTPRTVVVDLSRNEDHVPWAAIEQCKNGVIVSGKYQSRVYNIDRPHVIILANQPAPNVGRDISADRIIQIELREFIVRLDIAAAAPTAYDELRVFPSVRTFGRPQAGIIDASSPEPAAGPADEDEDDAGAAGPAGEEEEDDDWVPMTDSMDSAINIASLAIDE